MKPGDLLLVSGTGFLSEGIQLATESPVSHIGVFIAVDPFPVVIEALNRVKTRAMVDSIAEARHAWALTDETLTNGDRARIVAAAIGFTAQSYGYVDLFLQLLDATFSTRWFCNHWAWWLKRFPICSFVGARAWHATGRTFGVSDFSTTPADIDRWGRAHQPPFAFEVLK